MGQAAIPLIMMAVSTGASVYNTQQTAKKQDNALADMIRGDQRKQGQADRMVDDLLRDISSSDASKSRESATQQYAEAMRNNQGTMTGNIGTVAGGSDRYAQDAADAAKGIQSFGERRGDQMARQDSAGLQRFAEAGRMSQFGGDLGVLSRFADGDRRLGEMKRQGIRRNPWIDAASQAGMAYAGGGF